MATLLELLNTHQFTKGLDPNSEKAGMIKPDPGNAFDVNLKQSADWLKATPQLYGADIVRIMGQGQVDTTSLKKQAVKIGANLASKIPIVGGIVGGAISQLTNPKLPDDLIVGTEEDPKTVIGTLYTDLLYGRIRNDKGLLGNFLQSNEGLKNLGAKVRDTAISEGIGLATSVIAAGANALINKTKFTLQKPKLPSVKIPNPINYTDNFPSTFAFQSGVTSQIAINQSQFLNRPGVLGGAFGAGFELGKAEADIAVTKISNNPIDAGLIKGSSNRLDDYYNTTYKKLESKLDGFEQSIYLSQASDGKNGNPYNYEKINGTGNYSIFLGTSTALDTIYFNQYYGSAKNDISPSVDVQNDIENKITYTNSDGTNNIIRYNTSLQKASTAGNIDKILSNDVAFVTDSLQSQNKVKQSVNPYLTRKNDVLNDTGYDIVSLAINGIRLLGTITGLTDNASPSWSDAKPIGSGFKFYLYNSWEREISFKFQMYAENKTQLDLIWSKAEKIKKLTLPTPKGQLGIFGQLVPLKIGNIINTTYGFLSQCNLTVSDDSPWEITDGSQKPFIFEMDITYKVVSNTDNTTYTFYS